MIVAPNEQMRNNLEHTMTLSLKEFVKELTVYLTEHPEHADLPVQTLIGEGCNEGWYDICCWGEIVGRFALDWQPENLFE